MSCIFKTQGGGGGMYASIFVKGLSETDTVTASNGKKTKRGPWVKKVNPAAHGLPDGYTELSYIRSTGTQCINTKISGRAGYSAEIDFETTDVMPTSDATQQGFLGSSAWGAESSYTDLMLGWIERQHRFRLWIRENSTTTDQYGEINTISANTRYLYKVNVGAEEQTAYANGELQVTANAAISGQSRELYLFALNNSGTAESHANIVVHSAKSKLDGVEVQNLIPARRDSDGHVAMYDIVTGEFFPNIGTGEFIAGEEVPQYFEGHEITKIGDIGTWTVTATDGEQTTTKDVPVETAKEYNITMMYNLMTYFEAKEPDWVEAGGTFQYGDGLYQPRAGEKGTILSGEDYLKTLTIPIPDTVLKTDAFNLEFAGTVTSSSVSDMGGFRVNLLNENGEELVRVRRIDGWGDSDNGYQAIQVELAGTNVFNEKAQYTGIRQKYNLQYDGATLYFYVNDTLKLTEAAAISGVKDVQVVFDAYQNAGNPSVYSQVEYLKMTGA